MFALDLLRVPVGDLAAAEPFWTALLGRPPVSVDETAGTARYDIDGLDILVVRDPAGAGRPLGFHLSHDDPDQLLARLPASAKGRIEDDPGGGRSLQAHGPDGTPVRVRWRAPER